MTSLATEVGARGPRTRLLGAVLAFLALPGCRSGVLDPQGPVGTAEKTILFNSLAIMLAIVVPTALLALGVAWWFRESNPRAKFMPDFVYSGRIELVVWSIPTLVIIFLGGITWIGAHQLDPARPLESRIQPIDIQVVSLDWKWLFIYPEQGVASINQIVVPAATPIHFILTSASVMNAFFVPQLGSMIYTMNGMTTQLNLQADHEGEFHGLSSHYSGDGFSGMQFTLRAVSAGDFATWARTTADAGGPTLDRAAYTTLAGQSSDLPPSTFSSVEAGLFEAVAVQRVPPGPGPTLGKPERDVSPRQGG